jgi:hypothetical protein
MGNYGFHDHGQPGVRAHLMNPSHLIIEPNLTNFQCIVLIKSEVLVTHAKELSQIITAIYNTLTNLG